MDDKHVVRFQSENTILKFLRLAVVLPLAGSDALSFVVSVWNRE